MRNIPLRTALLVAGSLILTVSGAIHAQERDAGKMSFFVTSVGLSNGGDLGGIEGADEHCQKLA